MDKVTSDCGVTPSALTVIYAPTQSLAGATQVVARVLEVALHKAHELKFPLERIVDGMGAAPLSPPHPDFVTAMGRTNDAIIYGGRAQLYVTGPAEDAKGLAEALPSRASRDFGAPFAEIFKRFKGDFYAIDPMLFSPGRGHRHGDRKRREFSRRRGASQIARCLVRLTGRRRSADGPTILVVSDQRDWHARQMEAAFAAAGARVERIDLADCGFDTRSASGLSLPVLGSRLPDAVHVRTLSAGSFEAITKRLGVLHALTKLGVVVWNDARAIERCVDKSMTSFLLARAGVPTPPTWTMESAEAARALVEREAPRGPLVLKPLFGAQGKGLRLIRRPEDLPGSGRYRRGLLSAAVSIERSRGLHGLSAVRPARSRDRRDDAPRLDMDHQRQAGRPTLGRRA